MNEELKKIIIQDINLKIGGDINDLGNAYELENDLIIRRNKLQSSVSKNPIYYCKYSFDRCYLTVV